MNNMPAITGWNWLKEGAGLFRKQPAALTTLLFANILVSLLISAFPLIGAMLAVILIPSFSMAFMKACLMIENGERVTPAVLLTGFRRAAEVGVLPMVHAENGHMVADAVAGLVAAGRTGLCPVHHRTVRCPRPKQPFGCTQPTLLFSSPFCF